ncbi:MAG TPA: PAS domain-containing protein [Allosphingosinicella sp.]|nr:PAS domain-containing protein [Allosphingosinicella sp.]
MGPVVIEDAFVTAFGSIDRLEGTEGLLASIDHSPIASVITDARLPDNPIVVVNRAFCELTGYEREEIVGRNCRFLAGADTEPDGSEALRRAVAEGRPALVQLTNYRRDGSRFMNAVMIAPVMGEDGEIAYFLGTQMDVGRGSTLSAPRRQKAEALVRTLTPRQLQVLEHMIAGYRNKQIAGFLEIDEKTVKMHRASLLTRLKVGSSAEAIRIGVEAGIRLSDPG